MRSKFVHPITALFALALTLLPAPAARSAPTDNPEPTSGTLYVHRFAESVALTRNGTKQETTAKPVEKVRFILEPVAFDESVGQTSQPPDSTRPVTQASGQTGITEIQIRSLRTIGTAREAVTDKTGIATFSELPLGVYRVREDESGGVHSQAFLVQIPMPHPSQPDAWLYEVHAYPKLADTSVPVSTANRLATTGPTAVLIMAALSCLVAANLSIVRIRRKER